MAPRAYWKGHIRLALVSFPVRLYAAVSSTERIALHRIHRETGERVRNQMVVDGQPVERDDIAMGYEYERERYISVDEEELDALQIESKHTIDLARFVDISAIDPLYFDKPYYVAPDGDIATEAFITIRDALAEAGKVALGQIVLAKRERVVVIQPRDSGMLLQTLRFADEVRASAAYFDDIEDVSVSDDQIEMAKTLISARSGPFEPDTFKDRYQSELRALIEAKLKGRPQDTERPKTRGGSNVINLMDALKASLDDGTEKGKESAPKKPATRKRGTSQTARGATKSKSATTTRRSRTTGSAKGGGKADDSKSAQKRKAPAKSDTRRSA